MQGAECCIHDFLAPLRRPRQKALRNDHNDSSDTTLRRTTPGGSSPSLPAGLGLLLPLLVLLAAEPSHPMRFPARTFSPRPGAFRGAAPGRGACADPQRRFRSATARAGLSGRGAFLDARARWFSGKGQKQALFAIVPELDSTGDDEAFDPDHAYDQQGPLQGGFDPWGPPPGPDPYDQRGEQDDAFSGQGNSPIANPFSFPMPTFSYTEEGNTLEQSESRGKTSSSSSSSSSNNNSNNN
ncbi:unnamed protein product, partial [Pseudo-nitzschia multistriata]